MCHIDQSKEVYTHEASEWASEWVSKGRMYRLCQTRSHRHPLDRPLQYFANRLISHSLYISGWYEIYDQPASETRSRDRFLLRRKINFQNNPGCVAAALFPLSSLLLSSADNYAQGRVESLFCLGKINKISKAMWLRGCRFYESWGKYQWEERLYYVHVFGPPK